MNARDAEGWSTIHRIVFPDGSEPDGVTPLYFEARGSAVPLGRRALKVGGGSRASFATYFGALPSSVWLARTSVRRLRLRLRLDGTARLSVHATDAEGRPHRLWAQDAEGAGCWEVELDDHCGGWLWFEIDAAEEVVLSDAAWEAPRPARPQQTASVAITTHNRVADCLGVLEALAGDPSLQGRVRRIFVIDQGTERIREDARFPRIASVLGERLVVREQENLGGSGGFSRGMLEADETDATHVLLLDDDVIVEPETIHRLLSFADHADGEPLVGAQMLSLTEPTRLYSYGERIDRSTFWWGPVAPELANVDLTVARIEEVPALSRAYDVDFNGWWMCLVPLSAVRRAGAALPMFIKWDDAEYGLRAREAGHRTVTLPGAAIWHMPWTGKDDGLDWQAYFQLRNRLVAALIHGGRRRATLLLSAFAQDVNHVLCLQYGSAEVRAAALDDVLAGPAALLPTLRQGPERPIRILRAAGQVLVQGDADAVVRELPARPSRGAIPLRMLRVLSHQFRGVSPHGAVAVSRAEGKWWSAGLLDEVFLRSATGRGGFRLRRDRATAWDLLRGAARQYIRLWVTWPRTRRTYRDAAARLSALDGWRDELVMEREKDSQ